MHALAASCEDLRARTGNPPLNKLKVTTWVSSLPELTGLDYLFCSNLFKPVFHYKCKLMGFFTFDVSMTPVDRTISVVRISNSLGHELNLEIFT